MPTAKHKTINLTLRYIFQLLMADENEELNSLPFLHTGLIKKKNLER